MHGRRNNHAPGGIFVKLELPLMRHSKEQIPDAHLSRKNKNKYHGNHREKSRRLRSHVCNGRVAAENIGPNCSEQQKQVNEKFAQRNPVFTKGVLRERGKTQIPPFEKGVPEPPENGVFVVHVFEGFPASKFLALFPKYM